jgi:hypothetical protein
MPVLWWCGGLESLLVVVRGDCPDLPCLLGVGLLGP